MATNRFQVTRVSDYPSEKPTVHPSEIIPLIHVENDVPSPPPLPPSCISVNETSKSSRLFNSFIQRLKSHSSSNDTIPKVESNETSNTNTISAGTLTVNGDLDKPDPYYSTIQSNAGDTVSLALNDNFLRELRSKRRELREKASNRPIDQRIALNRQQHNQEIMRAQDIFAVHFELNDSENASNQLFNEDAQETIRNNIFDELDRQRLRQFHKQHRQLVFGRALLMLITSIILFMGITLVYVVIDLYDRANNLDSKLPDNEFISMIYDQTADTDI